MINIQRIKKNFEPVGLIDWLLIPWWMMRFVFAWCWMLLARVIDRKIAYWDGHFVGWGRHDDPTPVVCERCLWTGPLRWTIHTYHACGDDDVEPVDECPRCGSDI